MRFKYIGCAICQLCRVELMNANARVYVYMFMRANRLHACVCTVSIERFHKLLYTYSLTYNSNQFWLSAIQHSIANVHSYGIYLSNAFRIIPPISYLSSRETNNNEFFIWTFLHSSCLRIILRWSALISTNGHPARVHEYCSNLFSRKRLHVWRFYFNRYDGW